jgi:hypothetical protein
MKRSAAATVGLFAAVLGAAAFAAGCSDDKRPFGGTEQEAQPIDRLLLGQAAQYPADPSVAARSELLASNMAERRKLAWQIVAKIFEPVPLAARQEVELVERARSAGLPVDAAAFHLPRFQTWYSREDILPMFDRLFRGLTDDDKRARAPFTSEALDGIFPWNATMATSLPSFTEERLAQRRREIATPEGLASLGKGGRVLMSPSYVRHVLGSYTKALGCAPGAGGNSAGCLDGDFPYDAVSIKTRWMPSSMSIPVFDTSADALSKTLAGEGTFTPTDTNGNPDPSQAYTMRLSEKTTSRLVALHIMTKEQQDWVWITLWWSPDPNTDFGADRPASITGPFANYKMCVATSFDERDPAPGSHFTDPSLAAALDATAAAGGSPSPGEGPATWCSNPYLETQAKAARTNCIGCHQHGGTGINEQIILADENAFPATSRKKIRTTFPGDYAFTLDGGIDLASEMRLRVDALTPAQRPIAPR